MVSAGALCVQNRKNKTKQNPRISVNSCGNDLLPFPGWRNLIESTCHQMDDLSSQVKVPYWCFKIGLAFWEIEPSEKAGDRLWEFMLLDSYVASIYNPVITPFLYLSSQVWYSPWERLFINWLSNFCPHGRWVLSSGQLHLTLTFSADAHLHIPIHVPFP